MEVFSDLQVDVNGEEVFVVNKDIISSYSGRINKLFAKSKGVNRNLKVIFNDFPGGAANFELVARFCYNNGNVNINPSNICDLTCAAHYMEMDKSLTWMRKNNLYEQTELALEEIRYWTWSELMVALKKCQDLLSLAISNAVFDKCLDSLVRRVASYCETSPCPSTSSPDSSGFRLSCDTRSTDSMKNSFFRATWWFADLATFDTRVVKMLVKLMVSRNFDHGIICRFLFYYQKSRFSSSTSDEKVRILETVVEMLYSLDIRCVPYKSLFGLLRVALNINLSQCGKNKLESMIGLLLDESTLDDLLIPSPVGTSYLYDVNLVLRFLKSFLGKNACCVPLSRLKKVARLMDLYIAEVAPDRFLRPSKFLSLINALPNSARDSCDGVYYAMSLYLEVHSGLSEDQKMKVCCGLDYEKLSSEALNHLTRNANFPSKSAVQALISQQHKLKDLLQDTNQPTFPDSPFSPFGTPQKDNRKNESSEEQIVLYAKKLSISDENEKLNAHLQGMQWRVLELEKVCKKMQVQMTKMIKSRVSSQSKSKSIPRICS